MTLFKSDLWTKEPPKGDMFIWAYWDSFKETWQTGLGYWNVSGGWCPHAYGGTPEQVDYSFHPMPEPPQ